MATDDKLIERIKSKPTDFTVRELASLMKQCGCEEYQGGRGSGIRYYDPKTKRCMTFDLPHPGKVFKRYQIKMILNFLEEIGII